MVAQNYSYCAGNNHNKVPVRVPVLFKDLGKIVLMTAHQEQCTECDYKNHTQVNLLKDEPKDVVHRATLEPRHFNNLEDGKVVFYKEDEMLLEDENGDVISYQDRPAACA